MIVVYSFIGKLPHYISYTIKQTKLFFNGDIYLITDDINSPYLINLDIKIINYNQVIDNDFLNLVKENKDKFVIVKALKDRELLFMRAFERFYLLKNLLKKYNLQNCFFMEIDNLIYDNPNKWENILQEDIWFMFDSKKSISTGVSFFRNYECIEPLLSFYNNYIKSYSTTNNELFLSEMAANFLYYQKNKKNIGFLPLIWDNTEYNKETYMNYYKFNNSIFDGSSIGIYLCGYDKIHTGNKLVLHLNNIYSDINYTKYKFIWEKEDGKNIPYILDNNNNKIKINNLHIHSKELQLGMSIPV